MRHVTFRSMVPSMTALVLALGVAASARAQGAAPPVSSDGVTIISGETTRAGFAKGTPLIETANYKVHASRREGPGTAEVHARDIDIFYVLEGSATLVTGGRPVDAKTTAPDEVRGASIEGGTTRSVAKGDVIIIHNGVPHWFKDVQGPFLYYTVKVPTTAGASR
jgi:mannose-6-phosphate isomerase-like protein (cupin superfamily)